MFTNEISKVIWESGNLIYSCTFTYNTSSKMDVITDDRESRLAVLQDTFSNKISLQTAAEKLASIALSDDVNAGVGRLWTHLLTTALECPEHHDKLVSVLVHLSKLPDAKTEQGDPIILYNMQVWKDLPMLGWHFRYEWNGPSVPPGPWDRQQKAISTFINLNRFTALLMATEEPVFEYSWFALVTFRSALETPPINLHEGESLDATVPAAAAWVEIPGVEMYEWDKEFEHRPALGKGGPLWKGKHGFCEERWQFWRERFGVLARMEGKLGEEARTAAKDAEIVMGEIENGDVE